MKSNLTNNIFVTKHVNIIHRWVIDRRVRD